MQKLGKTIAKILHQHCSNLLKLDLNLKLVHTKSSLKVFCSK